MNQLSGYVHTSASCQICPGILNYTQEGAVPNNRLRGAMECLLSDSSTRYRALAFSCSVFSCSAGLPPRTPTGRKLGLQSSASEAGQQPEQPVVMRLGFRGMDAEPVEPVVLRKVGVEHDQRIRLAFRPTAARPVVELRTDLGSYDLRLEVVPRLEVLPDSVRPGYVPPPEALRMRAVSSNGFPICRWEPRCWAAL